MDYLHEDYHTKEEYDIIKGEIKKNLALMPHELRVDYQKLLEYKLPLCIWTEEGEEAGNADLRQEIREEYEDYVSTELCDYIAV